MLNRFLSTIITLAVLVSGATIGLEAAGLLFNAGKTQQERSAEAFLAQAEASLEAKDVPSEPVEETLPPPAARQQSAPPTRVTELNKVAAALLAAQPREDNAPAPAPAAVIESTVPGPAAPAPADDRTPPPVATLEPPAAIPGPIAAAAVAPSAPAEAPCGENCTAQVEPKPLAQPAGRQTARRARSKRMAVLHKSAEPPADEPPFELTVNLP